MSLRPTSPLHPSGLPTMPRTRIPRRTVVVAGLGMRASAAVGAVVAALLVAAPGAQAATPAWQLMAATGPTHVAPKTSEIQRLAVDATGGTYTLTFAGQATGPLAVDTSAEALDTALEALPAIGGAGGTVDVAGGPGDAGATHPYTIRFGGSLAGTNVGQLTTTPALTGGAATATVTTQTAGGAPGPATVAVYAYNRGGAPTAGSYTIQIHLPSGVTTSATGGGWQGPEWNCTPTGAGQSSVTCSASTTVWSGDGTAALLLPVIVNSAAPANLTAAITIAGGGATTATSYQMPFIVSETPSAPGLAAFWAGAFDENGLPETRAGAHPYLAASGFMVNTILSLYGHIAPAGAVRDVVVDTPAGFVANPMATLRCAERQAATDCGRDAIVGTAAPLLLNFGHDPAKGQGVFNVVPTKGAAAQLTFPYNTTMASIDGGLRPTDYGVRAVGRNIPHDFRAFGAVVTLWGEPGAGAHDIKRCGSTPTNECPLPNPGAEDDAFLTNPTECSGQTLSTIGAASFWQDPFTLTDPVTDISPAVTGCSDVPFAPIVGASATSSSADSPSGLDFDVSIPQEALLDPDAIAPSHLRDVVVDLPAGLAVNPSGATGLGACSDTQMAPGTDDVPACPDASKIGTVSITSPLVGHAIGGTMYLGTPKSTDPTSGQMLRLWVVARDDDLGILIKLPGTSTADPATGKLTATFKNNPRLPFDHLAVKLKGGNRGLLATPQTCATRSISSTLSPWSQTVAVTQSSALKTDAGCAFGFAPKVRAGNSNAKARGTGTFSFTFSREDGEQWVNGLTVALPTGLLASVKDVPLCTSAQADAGACPAASKVGTVDGTAGSGTPFVLEQKGSAFLTEGYKGCAYGLQVSVPVVAGPFDGKTRETDLGSVNVRQSVCVDPVTAQVTVTSDPLPTIWHGIPLRVRSITVAVDRDQFMVNPSSCAAKTVGAALFSANDGKALAAAPFAVTGCKDLAFAPGLSIGLTGPKKQLADGGHPGLTALATQQPGEAGIKQVKVALPLQLALDPDNAQGLCEYEAGLKFDCPDSSIIGNAVAVSPLLNKPLSGPVYFVKNVRFNAKGQPIRTLPTLIVKLDGEIAINLRANTNVDSKNRLVNTFSNVPDAPISAFALNIDGGKHGVLVVTHNQNACKRLGKALAETNGQNNTTHDFQIKLRTSCAKKAAKKSAGKRAKTTRTKNHRAAPRGLPAW
ncbi:MAG: hypothetical protein ACJ762_06220 [Solirubrobacteraceae bacterium]